VAPPVSFSITREPQKRSSTPISICSYIKVPPRSLRATTFLYVKVLFLSCRLMATRCSRVCIRIRYGPSPTETGRENCNPLLLLVSKELHWMLKMFTFLNLINCRYENIYKMSTFTNPANNELSGFRLIAEAGLRIQGRFEGLGFKQVNSFHISFTTWRSL